MVEHEAGERAPRSPGRATPTIYDVAEYAGVSPSTVSRALNHPGRINIKTERRIRDAAAHLDYRLNPMARALPTGRTATLGLLVADITNPVIFDLVRGAERAAAQRGYLLVVSESQESREAERDVARKIQTTTDALILGTTRLADNEIGELAEAKPVVPVNRAVGNIDCVLTDMGPGVDQALAHIEALGHSDLVYVSGPRDSWVGSQRWAHLRRGAAERGMGISEVGPVAPTVDGGTSAYSRVIASRTQAVVAFNDLIAIGLLRTAQAQGLPVPDSFGVIGFDDVFGADFTTPTLTTVRSPLARAGQLAVDTALSQIEGTPRIEHEDLASELIVRASIGRARH